MNFTDLRILKTRERLQNALLELLAQKEMKAITVKEICDKAGISRNAFYQHYSYKEDLFDQMVEQATEQIRNSLRPLVSDISQIRQDIFASYAKRVINGISEVKELIYVMLKNDDGQFLRQMTDLISGQFLSDAIPFFQIEDSALLQLYYEFLSGGMSAFVIKWVLEGSVSEEKAAELLSEILLLISTQIPMQLANQKPD